MTSLFGNIQGVLAVPGLYPSQAKADGVTDDWLAIQSVIDANPGKIIYLLPSLTYRITQPLQIKTNGTKLCCANGWAYIRQDGVDVDGIQIFCTSTATKTTFLESPALSGISIFRTTSGNAGAGVRVTQADNGQFDNIWVGNFPEGVKVFGGQLSNYNNVRCYASAGVDRSGVANSSMLSFQGAPIDGGLYQSVFSTTVTNIFITPSKLTETCIHVSECDDLQFKGGYIANGANSLVKMLPLRDNSNISGFNFTDVYTDAVTNSTGSKYCWDIPAHGFANAFIYSMTIQGGLMGNTNKSGMLIRNPNLYSLIINAVQMVNFNESAIDMDAGSARTNFQIANCNINSTNLSGTGARGLKLGNARIVQINGGQILNGNVSYALSTFGTIAKLSVNDWVISATGQDWEELGTATKLSLEGNISDNANALTTLCGGTFIPTVTFNNLSTGITYGTRSGSFILDGDRVEFELAITLTSKGSATGLMLVTNLPYTNTSATNTPVSLRISSVTSGVGDTYLTGSVLAGTSVVRIDKITTGNLVQLADTDFTNTTQLQISGEYKIN